MDHEFDTFQRTYDKGTHEWDTFEGVRDEGVSAYQVKSPLNTRGESHATRRHTKRYSGRFGISGAD